MGQRNVGMPPALYLREMNEAAQYVFGKGMPFFVGAHYRWLRRYDRAWRGTAADAPGQTLAMLRRSMSPGRTGRIERWLSRLLESAYVRDSTRAYKALTILPLAAAFVSRFTVSIVKSLWNVVGGGVRTAPPLVAAVVVVFATGDGWRLLARGFGLRFALFEALFLGIGLAFLARLDYWRDIEARTEADQEALLKGIDSDALHDLVRRGAAPFPIVQPDTAGGRRAVRAGYFMLLVSSLLGSAVVVSLSLIIVGVILIGASETVELTGSAAHLYWRIPGTELVLTRELVSLSLSLGAFAALFLVASQHPEDRAAYLHRALFRLRRALVVYSVYRRAQEHAPSWTGVPNRAC